MLIEIDGEWVEHTAIVNIEPTARQREGMPKTEYGIEVVFIVGKSYHTITTKCGGYIKRDKLLKEMVEKVNAEHIKDRECYTSEYVQNMGPR